MTDCIHGLFLLCPTNDSAPQPCDSLTHILRQPRNPSFGTDESLRRSSLSRLTGSDLMSTDTPEAPRLYHFLKLPMWLSYHEIVGRASVLYYSDTFCIYLLYFDNIAGYFSDFLSNLMTLPRSNSAQRFLLPLPDPLSVPAPTSFSSQWLPWSYHDPE